MKRLLAFSLVLFSFGLFAEMKSFGFDEKYAMQIVEARGGVRPPESWGAFAGIWRVSMKISFDNGLYGVREWMVSEEWHARQILQRKYAGNANVVKHVMTHSDSFGGRPYFNITGHALVQEFDIEGLSYPEGIGLYVDPNYSFDSLPRVAAVSENVQVTPGWIFDSHSYQYDIELSDGTQYHSVESSYDLQLNQWIGQRVLKIGNRKERSLINIDAALVQAEHRVYGDVVLAGEEI